MAKNKWIKPRHKVITKIADFVLKPIAKIKFGARFEKLKKDKRQYLVLYNHQTSFDQFFIEMCMRRTMYFVATEDIFSNGFVSTLLRWAVAPIPIKKQTNDMRAVMNCVKIVKEGGSIAIAPEGNRTYSGETCTFKESIVKLAKLVKLPIAFVRIEGGYGVEPRWSDVKRKGKIRVFVPKILEPEEISKLSDKELLEEIGKQIYVDETKTGGLYKHKNKAEYIERALYVCPHCGLTQFKSTGNEFSCTKCGLAVSYGEDLTLKAIKDELPFKFVKDWYNYQNDYVNSLDLDTLGDKPLYTDLVKAFKVVLYKNKKCFEKHAEIKLYNNKITVSGKKESLEFNFDDVSSISVLGRKKINVYYKDDVYQFKGNERFNALKYMNFYYRYKNVKEQKDGKFLGI